jgi:hypothetical protein
MPQRSSTEMAHVTRDHNPDHEHRSGRFAIHCPYCQAPLDAALTLAELRARHHARPGDAVTAACGHTYRLPQPFPAV